MNQQEVNRSILSTLERLDHSISTLTEVLTAYQRAQRETAYQRTIGQEWYSVSEFSTLTNIPVRTVQERCKKGQYLTKARIPGQKLEIHFSHVIDFYEGLGISVEVALRKNKRKK